MEHTSAAADRCLFVYLQFFTISDSLTYPATDGSQCQQIDDHAANSSSFATAGEFFSERNQEGGVREGESMRLDHISNQGLAGEPRIDPITKLYRSDGDGGLFICR